MAPVTALTEHTGYWLRVVSNAVSQRFARKLAEQDVTVAEWVLMRTLHDVQDAPPSALAQQMGMTKGAISKLTDRLQEKALIESTDDPLDKRSHRLRLSEEGRRRLPLLADLADENDAHYFGALDPQERAALDRALRSLVKARRLSDVPLD